MSLCRVGSRSFHYLGRRGISPLQEVFHLRLVNISEQPNIYNHDHQQRWFSKNAKMAGKLESLREQAHRPRRAEAKEKREKKKEKKLARKQKKGEGAAVIEETDISSNLSENDDLIFEGDELNDDEDEDDTSLLPDPSQLKKAMTKTIDRLTAHFKSIRGAEPTPELFDDIIVNAYGEKTPLAGVAQVVIQSPTLANVTCFDPSLVSNVRKALMEKLDLNPELEEEGSLRVPLPRISMEVREKTVKQLRKQAEATRTRIRNLRKKPMKQIKAGKEGKLEGVSKDDAFRVLKEIDVVTEDVMKLVTSVLEEKEQSVMAV